MGVCVGRHGSQVRDAEDLVIAGDVAELLSDSMGCFSADVGVDLVKDEDGDFVLLREDGF